MCTMMDKYSVRPKKSRSTFNAKKVVLIVAIGTLLVVAIYFTNMKPESVNDDLIQKQNVEFLEQLLKHEKIFSNESEMNETGVQNREGRQQDHVWNVGNKPDDNNEKKRASALDDVMKSNDDSDEQNNSKTRNRHSASYADPEQLFAKLKELKGILGNAYFNALFGPEQPHSETPLNSTFSSSSMHDSDVINSIDEEENIVKEETTETTEAILMNTLHTNVEAGNNATPLNTSVSDHVDEEHEVLNNDKIDAKDMDIKDRENSVIKQVDMPLSDRENNNDHQNEGLSLRQTNTTDVLNETLNTKGDGEDLIIKSVSDLIQEQKSYNTTNFRDQNMKNDSYVQLNEANNIPSYNNGSDREISVIKQVGMPLNELKENNDDQQNEGLPLRQTNSTEVFNETLNTKSDGKDLIIKSVSDLIQEQKPYNTTNFRDQNIKDNRYEQSNKANNIPSDNDRSDRENSVIKQVGMPLNELKENNNDHQNEGLPLRQTNYTDVFNETSVSDSIQEQKPYNTTNFRDQNIKDDRYVQLNNANNIPSHDNRIDQENSISKQVGMPLNELKENQVQKPYNTPDFRDKNIKDNRYVQLNKADNIPSYDGRNDKNDEDTNDAERIGIPHFYEKQTNEDRKYEGQFLNSHETINTVNNNDKAIALPDKKSDAINGIEKIKLDSIQHQEHVPDEAGIPTAAKVDDIFVHPKESFKNSFGRADIINVVPWDSELSQPKFYKCVSIKVITAQIQTCTHSALEDPSISAVLLAHGKWGFFTLRNIRIALMDNDDAGFIDIGAGIGVYSLAAAVTNRQVIAVEPSAVHIGPFLKSVNINGFSDRITLLMNVVSDQHGKVIVSQSKNDINKIDIKPVDITNFQDNNVFELITLNDIVRICKFRTAVLKINVPGYVRNVLAGSEFLFSALDVTHVLTRWDSDDEDLCMYLITFFTTLGYSPCSDLYKNDMLDPEQFLSWKITDVVWKRM